MALAMAGFTLNDAIMKTVSGDQGIGLMQAILIRGCIATVLVGIVAYFSGAFHNLPNLSNHRQLAWRSLAEVLATLSFLTALLNLPIANATAIISALPLTLTLGAALFLSEPFGWRRGVAIVIGLFGLLLIVQPATSGFNSYSLLVVFCVLCVTFRDLVVRRIDRSVSNLYMAFLTAAVVTIMGGVGVLIHGHWDPVSVGQLALLACSASALFVGYYGVVSAIRLGDVGFTTLFRYTGILWAIALGFVIWGELPNLLASIGIVTVTATGLFALWREGRVR